MSQTGAEATDGPELGELRLSDWVRLWPGDRGRGAPVLTYRVDPDRPGEALASVQTSLARLLSGRAHGAALVVLIEPPRL